MSLHVVLLGVCVPDLAVVRANLSRSSIENCFAPLAQTLGFDAITHPVDWMADSVGPYRSRLEGLVRTLRRAGGYTAQGMDVGLWVAETCEWPRLPSERDRIRRRVAKALVEATADARMLIVLAHPAQRDFELVFPRVRPKRGLGTVRALIDREYPTRHHLELVEQLILPDGQNLLQVSKRWGEAFSVERVAKDFYEAFRKVRDRFIQELAAHNPGTVFTDEERAADVRRFATRNLGRVLFLWFLQSKRWLDDDSRYLVNQFRKRCGTDPTHNFFRDTLVPLFLEALAMKPEDRPKRTKDLGDLPYLNGGLFFQTHLEDELYGCGREHVSVEVPNDLFDPDSATEVSLLSLLRRYRFTTQESTPDDLSVDPDPELLGKVFENLNETQERKGTGTFYTPREIVHFMCQETLDGYLVEKTGVDRETLRLLREEARDPEATDLRLAPAERARLEAALRAVTVCDPAVGSGAFLVGMLHEIIELRRGIYQSADTVVPIGGQMVAEWKQETITRSLYGVDINPEAVEIAQLRLWLSLVIDADRPEPLPNLDFRLVAGDSLVDRVGTDTLRGSLPTQDHLGLLDPAQERRLHDIEAELYVREEAFSCTEDPHEARILREEIRKFQVQAVRLQVEWLRGQTKAYLSRLRDDYATLERLGAGSRELTKAAKTIASGETRVATIAEMLAGLDPWASYFKPMLWPVEFPEVFEAGGFDIVLANPPYVRQEKLSTVDQHAYQAAFPDVFAGTADLLVFFFSRALQILKDRGQLAFITSNKYMRAGYGDGLRGLLPKALTLRHVIDFGDLPVFDAAAYPAVVVGTRRPPDDDHVLQVADLNNPVRRALKAQESAVNVGTVREELNHLDTLLADHAITPFPQTKLKGDGWVLEHPRLLALFERLMGMGTPLGQFVSGRMYYGIKTGLNEAFVIHQETRDRLVKEDPRSAELIKPWLRGRDIKRWRAEWAGWYVIAVQNSADADAGNPWGGAASEKAAREVFASTYPAIHAHLSEYEDKLKSRVDQGKFWWELRACAYYHKLSEAKIIFSKFIASPMFAFDTSGSYVGNANGVVVEPPSWLFPLMQSSVFWFLLSLRLTRLQNGYYQVMNDNLAAVPLVKPAQSAVKQLEAVACLGLDGHMRLQAEAELDSLSCDVYGLTKLERKALTDWLSRTTEMTSPPTQPEGT